jgi:hypothetical protein
MPTLFLCPNSAQTFVQNGFSRDPDEGTSSADTRLYVQTQL